MKIKLISFALIWYISGVASFVYWWTNQNDFMTRHIPLCLSVGLFGPIAFPVGYIIHGDDLPQFNDVLIERRE